MKKTRHGSACLGGLLAALATLACEQAAPPQTPPTPEESDPQRAVLARVGDEVVTVEDLGFIPVTMNPANKLETLVVRKLAAAEARRRGLAEEPRTREKLAQFRQIGLMWEEGLLRNALYNQIRLGMTFSEAELRAHYASTRNRYVEPQWKLRLKRFPSEAEARAAAEALGASGRLDSAQSESLGPVPAEQLPPALGKVLPLLEQPGDRQLVAFEGQYALVELEEHLPSATVSFEAARERVDQEMRAVRAEAVLNGELARLRAEQVTIDQEALAKIEQDRAGRAAKRADVRNAALEARRARRQAAQAGATEAAPAGNAPAEAAPAQDAPAEAAPAGETP